MRIVVLVPGNFRLLSAGFWLFSSSISPSFASSDSFVGISEFYGVSLSMFYSGVS